MGKERYDLDCKTVVFSSKSVKKSVKRGVSVEYARSARASHARSACEPAAPLPYKCRDRGSDGRRAKRGKRGNKGQPGTSKGKRYLYLTKTFRP